MKVLWKDYTLAKSLCLLKSQTGDQYIITTWNILIRIHCLEETTYSIYLLRNIGRGLALKGGYEQGWGQQGYQACFHPTK